MERSCAVDIYCTAALTSFSDSVSYITFFSRWRITSEISEKHSVNKNKLNTTFDNGFHSKLKGLRRLEWLHCLSHKDLRYLNEFLAKNKITTFTFPFRF